MPFFSFQRTSTATATATIATHHRQSSLSSSKDRRLAEIKSQTVAMAQSGELTLSRSRPRSATSGSGHKKTLSSSGSHHYRTHGGTGSGPTRPGVRGIVVQEPDEDSSRHTKRIDQGILDASREGLDVSRQRRERELLQQQQQMNPHSWWSSWSYGGTPVVSPGNEASGEEEGRKTTVSRTFRVP